MESAKSETKYERLRKIGIGSYGVVFKCVNRQTGQIVAIKRYSENDSDPNIRKIAMREVRILRQLRHPNLIHLIEVFRRKRILHLVFDYCELTVLDVIEKYTNNCPLNLIKKIIWQLVNGVSHCHSHNCIHRDIKPENILINQAGVVKLCDFGFARNLKGNSSVSGGSSGGSSSRTTAACAKQIQYEREAKLLGVVVPPHQQHQHHHELADEANQCAGESAGESTNKENDAAYFASERQALTEYVATRWYRAPELLVGDIYYDIKIDIWAIGCVTAELMRGEPLWPGKTDLDQLCNIMGSLGALTASQSHTLLTVGLYDQSSTERLLGASRVVEPLELRVPARVGQTGLDFVLACLRMDPARRLTSNELLQHAYIQSAQMSQFVKGASQTAAVSSSISRDAPAQRIAHAATRANRAAPVSRSNSQAILRAANQQPPASKRLVLAPDSTSPSGSSSANTSGAGSRTTNDQMTYRTNKQQDKTTVTAHSLVPVPVRNFQKDQPARSPREQPSDVICTSKATSSRRRRDNKPPPPEIVAAAAAPYSRTRGTQQTSVAAPAQMVVATPIGTVRRSGRLSLQPSQSNLLSVAHSQQQQIESTRRRTRQQRPMQTRDTGGHLVVLVEPTKRDRQRRQ